MIRSGHLELDACAMNAISPPPSGSETNGTITTASGLTFVHMTGISLKYHIFIIYCILKTNQEVQYDAMWQIIDINEASN